MAFGAEELPRVDHVQRLDSRDQSARAVEVLEAEHGPHHSFERSVSLLHEVVQIFGLAQLDGRAAGGQVQSFSHVRYRVG